MNLTLDINTPRDIADNIKDQVTDTADLGGFGTFFLKTDDNAMIGVLVTENHDRIYELYAQLSAMQGISTHVYLVVVGTPGMTSQLLAVQEMGVFTVCLESYQRLGRFVKFIADPKRRTEKKILPARKVSVFTPAEQILMQIPGLGEAKIGAILQMYGSLAMAMSVMSWYDADMDMPGVITKKMIQEWRTILGLKDGHVLMAVPLDRDE